LAISKERRQEVKAVYVDLLNQSNAIILTEFSELSVQKMEQLRDEVLKADGRFHVTKNSLLGIALEETGQPVPEALLQGPTATGFVFGAVTSVAKTFVDYAKAEEKFSIKGGILDKHILSAADVEALASLPSLDQLRAQIIGLINGPSQGIVSALANGVRQVINVVDAYAKQEESVEAEVQAG
jgi:large subunit ribosomal protein L10